MKLMSLKDIRLLVAEDDPDLRLAVTLLAESLGCLVKCTSCGRDAFDAFKNNKFDMVLTDVDMPNGDGLWLIENLLAVSPAIPIVLMTGGALSPQEAVSKGATKFLQKPMSRSQLLSAMVDARRLKAA